MKSTILINYMKLNNIQTNLNSCLKAELHQSVRHELGNFDKDMYIRYYLHSELYNQIENMVYSPIDFKLYSKLPIPEPDIFFTWVEPVIISQAFKYSMNRSITDGLNLV